VVRWVSAGLQLGLELITDCGRKSDRGARTADREGRYAKKMHMLPHLLGDAITLLVRDEESLHRSAETSSAALG